MKRDARSRLAKSIDKEPIDYSGVRSTQVKAESNNVGFVVTFDDDDPHRVHIQFDVMSDGSPSVIERSHAFSMSAHAAHNLAVCIAVVSDLAKKRIGGALQVLLVEEMPDHHTLVFTVKDEKGVRKVPITLCSLEAARDRPNGALVVACVRDAGDDRLHLDLSYDQDGEEGGDDR
jgi:hypothetical protein